MYHTACANNRTNGLNRRDISTAMNIRSRFAILLLLFALTWQALLVQGHIHPANVQPVAARAAGHVAISAASSGFPDAPVTCPLCQEQALSGSYVPVDPAVIVPPAAYTASYLPSRFPAAIETQSFHSWRSRAPPRSSSFI
jgi:hypothetical protein